MGAYHDRVRHCYRPHRLLRMGSLETTAAIHAAQWLAAYHRRFPHVDLSLHTGTTDDLVQRVLDRTLDAAFIAGDIDHPDIARREVAVEDLRIVTASDCNWPSAVRGPEVVTVTFRQGCTYRRYLEDWLIDRGVIRIRVMECGSVEAILQLVSAGLGITLMPKAVVEPLSTRIASKSHPLGMNNGRIATYLILQAYSSQDSHSNHHNHRC